MVAAETVALISQRKAKEAQALTRSGQLNDPRFLTVDGQSKLSFQQSLDPPDQLPGLIARQHHKVISVPHQLGIGPSAGTVGAVELLLEPMQIEIGQQGRKTAPLG